MSILGIAAIRSFSTRVAMDPSTYGRVLGYGVLGTWCVAAGLTWFVAALLAAMLVPLLILGMPIGLVAAKAFNPALQPP